MKLTTRAALVPLSTVSILTVGLFILVQQLTVNSFSRLETQILHRQVERVVNAVENLKEEHAKKIVDWAQWDKTYDFMKSLSPTYIDETLNGLTISALGFSDVLYFTPKLDLRYGVSVESEESVVPASGALVHAVKSVLASQASSPLQTLVMLNGNPTLLAASPILPNKGDKASRGFLVATAKVNRDTFQLLQHLTNLKLEFQNPENTKEMDSGFQGNLPGDIQEVSEQLAYAYGSLKDAAEKPVLKFRVLDSREISGSSVKMRNIAIAVLGGSGVLAVLFLIGVTHISATRRMHDFSAQLKNITRSGVNEKRLGFEAGGISLRTKTAGGVFLVFLIMSLGTGIVLNSYFIKGFDEVEDRVMIDNLERAGRALTGRLEKIKGKTIDWAQWDDTYAFVQDRNKAYSSANLGYDTLGSMNLKYVLYFNAQGNLVDGREIAAESESIIPIDPAIAKIIASVPSLVRPSEPRGGFIALPNSVALLATSPILDTSRAKPSRGAMLFSTLADANLAKELGHQTQLRLAFKAPTQVSDSLHSIINRHSATSIEGLVTILDVNNKPVIDVSVTSARPILEYAIRTTRLLPAYFILGGIICALATVFWINRILLRRIGRMAEEVSGIQISGEANARVSIAGSDEISGLASDINSMLSALQKTQEELRAARQEAEMANAAKSMFIARVSHELRTPVGGIVGINRIIKKQAGLPRSVRELIEMGDLTAHSLLSIVDEILEFSKAESGEFTFEKIPFDVRQLVREIMQTISGRLEGKYKPEEKERPQLVCDIHPNIPPQVLGDPTKLKQILVNLLGNAVKFTQKGNIGLRVLRSYTSDSEIGLSFEVWDTGIGIPQEKLGTVFEPFKQADSSVNRKYQGTGLGLSIVKQFTEGLGGKVGVQSHPNAGTSFTVQMPFGLTDAREYNLHSSSNNAAWPKQAMVVAGASVCTSTISKSLTLLGATTELLDPFTENPHLDLSERFGASDLLIVSEEALSLPNVSRLIGERAAANNGCTVAMLKPSSLKLKEKLYGEGVKYVLPTPVLADDLLLAYLGKLPQLEDAPKDSEEGLKFDRKLRILVVDDIATNRIILEDMLGDAGHQVASVSDGTEMIERLQGMVNGEPNAEWFDLVLTDISMAIMDGDEATRTIRELERKAGKGVHTPIIAVTAHALKAEQEKIMSSGMDGMLTKPIHPEMVAAEFARVLLLKKPERDAIEAQSFTGFHRV